MATRTVTLDEFRDHWLELLDDVDTLGEEVVVLRHGRAAVRVTREDAPPARTADEMRDSVRYKNGPEDAMTPTGAWWDGQDA